MGQIKDILRNKGLEDIGDYLESLGHKDINKIYEMVENDSDVWKKLKMDSEKHYDDRKKLQMVTKERSKDLIKSNYKTNFMVLFMFSPLIALILFLLKMLFDVM